ncbi:uncharacterized protein C8R40DRAFT_1065302, partial [Lentinula edodes]
MATAFYTVEWIAPMEPNPRTSPFDPDLLKLLYAYSPPAVRYFHVPTMGGIRLSWKAKEDEHDAEQVTLRLEQYSSAAFQAAGFDLTARNLLFLKNQNIRNYII